MFQATRRRLALWYTSVTAVLLLIFAIGIYLYVRDTLIERIDDTLNHVVEVIERSLVIEPVNLKFAQFKMNVEASFRDNAGTVEDDHIDLEWFSPTGELLWSTFSQPLNIPIHFNRDGETVRLTGQTAQIAPVLLRQVTERVQIGRQVLGYLRVSHPWFEVTKPTRRLIFDLALGITLMVLSVAASGWFLSGKAMKPVSESYQRLKQFTADASHELRSPITLIQTNVQVALADLELVENSSITSHYQQQLKVVERLTQRLGKLVNDLLFLARQDSGISKGNFSSCPIDALLIEIIEEQKLLAKDKNISLSLDLAVPQNSENDDELLEKWFAISGSWNQLARLFTNLIDNALHYTPVGGQVKVKLLRIEVINRVSGLRHHTSQMQIKVSDTGIGIPSESIPHLFDRFYRVDPAHTYTTTGSGLGLAIAQAIVENHQGSIQVESIQGIGTTFTVNLPILVE